jgi:preprotein translocase subunit SecA
MQEAAYHRIAELIPTVRIEAVEKEEEELKKAQARLALGGGSSEVARVAEEIARTPIRKNEKIGRNDFVTITNGTDTETMKFKKAEPLLASGEWKVVEK